MMKGERSKKMRAVPNDHGFTEIVLSWSLEQIENKDLFKDQVKNIPRSFESVHQYFSSYLYPLLEETHAQLYSSMEIISTAPFAKVFEFDESKPCGENLYDVQVDNWSNRCSDRSKEPYKTLPGDILILADAKPEHVSDLQRIGRSWAFVMVTKILEDDVDDNDDIQEDNDTSTSFKVKALKDIDVDGGKKSLFVVFLTNTIPNKRMWNALHMHKNLNIIKKVLCTSSLNEEDCDICSAQSDGSWDEKLATSITSELNESQNNAVLACLRKIHCNHKLSVELIWGPPGTGKTKTTGSLLFTLLRMGYRTLTCAPTNVAITEVASHVLKLVKESFETDIGIDALFHSFGDILLFGNKKRLKVGLDMEIIYLDYRVQKLTECLGPLTGWRHCFTSMIDLLEDCVSQFHIFLHNELIKEKEQNNEEEIKEIESEAETYGGEGNCKSFLDFLRKRFVAASSPLKNCLRVFCTHLPKKYILKHNFQKNFSLIDLLESFETLLFKDNVESEALEELFSHSEVGQDISEPFMDIPFLLNVRRKECLSLLKKLQGSFNELDLPSSMNKWSIMDFCFKAASLIFCTASSSYMLHSVEMNPLNILVIDEAPQLKECESTIPLQLPGLRHAILVGDDRQLPAWITSNISEKVGFGRSLFERLSSLGCTKHLLRIQYRMHPSISFFPNANFYDNQILDAPDVKRKSNEKQYLPGPMFGPYSFISVIDGREEKDDSERSWRNMVEVSIVMKILQNLYKAWIGTGFKQNYRIGVISPYAAQVVAIQERLGQKFDALDGFTVKVKSVDGFQGGEEDLIIISTVRSNTHASIGFTSNQQRANVALTRARHCLWILGNDRTLVNGGSVWETLVLDAKNRQCFFNADEDKDLAKAILDVKKKFEQFDDLLNHDSILFRSAKWKVLFSDNFLKSFQKLKSTRTKKSVINLLLKISCGWRPKKLSVVCESSSQILKQFKVEGLYIVCANDMVKEWGDIAKELKYIQVLKIWYIAPIEDIPKLVKRLDSMFEKYTDDFINLCQEKCLEGDLEIPKSSSISFDIVRIKNLDDHENGSDLSGCAADGRSYVENARVSESLMLMKFYSLSPCVVTHLLSNHDGGELDLPFEVSDQEQEIILFPRSTFVLGRSGTGKTTVLTMKLFQKEKLHHKVRVLLHEEKEVEETAAGMKENVLHQLFVTVSPKLCYAVKQHVSHLKSFSCGGNSSKGSSSIDMDDFDNASQFKDIPDSFLDVPPLSYPLVITFHKFLIMLDGTVGNSYFERFQEARKLSNGPICGSSVSLQSFIRMKEVNYERFSTSYWPRFNTRLTKKLDSSRVFTEIISHIKGGPQAAEAGDGKLSREDYVLLSEGRNSRLYRQKREIIYEIFQNYEKMKNENGEFDFSDLVIDLHRRLRVERYEGNEMDFVYVDEVQDLTLSQIALFKYICKNVEEGFVFSGDTAQTIAKGIDFRFQDIRSLFYNKFVLESKSNGQDGRKEKGIISDIFHLSQNFRTHDGVLKLSQSVIELIYRYFPQSIDVLQPETSLIYGEAPILLESGNKENAIVTIFGNSGNARGSIVGFGAEQVILVRDDFVRKEITNHVGNQALVLTIEECKGLEFQDVLLYNFFGSSSLKDQWRVIYKYMEEQDLLDPTLPIPAPCFNEAKHSVLCSELKQLYVAITRTRQRLWISENSEDFCKPMFDYWKNKCIVQVRQLDYLFAQAMQVTSSPEEWKSRGIKLYLEHMFEFATMCFERAGDIYWQRMSKAAGLRENANHMRGSNLEKANVLLRQAAEIFETIGKADSAAQCFFDLGEYERAGRLYLEKCGESELQRAVECFCLAGCYELAAEVYAKGNFFSECLKVCITGKIFNVGFKHIQYWKNNATKDFGVAGRGQEIDKIEHEFLESCARHHHELKDSRSMMQFVKAFQSIDLMRTFLKSLDCLGELQLLEEESGNFLEAASIAKLRGEILHEADLLGKAGNVKEASMLLLFYVLYNSLWTPGSKGWPLKQFTQKQELLAKAKSFAKNDSNFYSFICTEADILSNEQSDLSITKEYLNASQRHNSVGGEIISARKILDAHLQSNSAKYVWQDYFVFDLTKHSEHVISRNQISVETLFYFWNFWKDKILSIFKYLRCLDTNDVNEYRSYGDFCLNYLGVRRQFHNLNAIYVVLNSDADWVREDSRFIHRNGNLVYIDVRHFVATAQSYWCSELLLAGMKVLDNLETLYNFSLKNSLSLFCQSRSLTCIYEVAKFLLESKYLNRSHYNNKTLQRFVELCNNSFFGYIFPLDWRKSLAENMFSLRESEVSRNLLEQIIIENISLKGKLTYGQIGRVVVITLGLGKINNGLYKEILKRFDGTYGNPLWKAFIQALRGNMGPEFPQGTLTDNNCDFPREFCVLLKLQEALMETYFANWREVDYISPGCFLYLIERLQILASYFQGYFFTSKSSFAEWFIYQDADTNPNSTLAAQMRPSHDIFEFILNVAYQLLFNKKDTMEWIGRSNIIVKDYYPLLVLRLVSTICLVHLNSGEFLECLVALLDKSYIIEQLPWEFYDVIQGEQKHINVNALAKAFKKIENPLVIVSLGGNRSRFLCPDAIFVDMTVKQCREDMLKVLFPETVTASQGQAETFEVEATNTGNEVLSSGTYDQDSCNCKSAPSNFALVADLGDLNNVNGSRLQVNYFWEIFEALTSLENGKDPRSFLLNVQMMKLVNVEKSIHLVSTVMHECLQNAIDNVDENLLDEVDSMVDELKQLSAALDVSEPELGNNMSTIQELCKRLLSRRPNLEPILRRLYLEKCGESELQRTGECFCLAGCYELAAEVYAKGNFFSECLKVCTTGKLFNVGFKYIQYWKNNATKDFGVARRGQELDKIEHEFLESCARHHHELKDSRSMMQFVKAFQSIDLMRTFLKSLDCHVELLLLEEESGNFLEAASIAKLRGEILHEADLLGKAGNVKEASMLLLFYVLYNSLWTPGSKGWPLKQFTQKQELLAKAKSFAKNDSNFYSFICTEADILSNEQSDLSITKEYLNASQRHNSVGGEIISARKILDAHLQSNSAKYVWQDYFVFDPTKHSEHVISRNQISVETLLYFWNFWKDKILSIFKYLRCLDTNDVNEYKSYGDFCLNYLGVRRQFHNLNAIYVLLNSDADWVREDSRFIHRNGNLVYIDVRHFVATAQSYWCSELLCAGMKVLDNLEALYNFSLKNSLSLFCQSRSLTCIYEVAKNLLESKYLYRSHYNNKTLQRFVELCNNSFFGYIFPLDWRKSLAENMFSLRESEVSRNLLERIIIENISLKGKLTYGQIGRVVVITLGLGKINNGLYKEILKRFGGTYGNPPWKAFIQALRGNMGPEFPQGTLTDNNCEFPREFCVLLKLQEALMETYNANWRKKVDYISPGCFLYLIEHLLILASYFQGYFITLKSSFAEWFIYQDANTNPNSTLVAQMRPSHGIFEFIFNVAYQLLFNKKDTMDWIRRTNIIVKDYYPLLVLRLVSIICLVHLNSDSGEYLESLFELLGSSYITEQLPWEFYDVVQRSRKHINVNALAEAFKKIHNPLVIVSLGGNCSRFLCPDAIFVDMTVKHCKEDMLKVLFPETVKASEGQAETFEVEATNSGNEVLSSGTYDQDSCNCKPAPSNFALVADQGDLNNINRSRLQVNYFWEIFEALKSLENGKDPSSFLLNVQMMKVNVEKSIHLVSTVMHERLQNAIENVDENLLEEVDRMVDELKRLSAALDVSEPELGNSMSTIQELCKRLLSRRPNLEPILSKQLLQLGTNLVVETSGSISNEQQCDVDSDSKAKENSSADVASVSNSKNSRETENKVKGNKSRKNKG